MVLEGWLEGVGGVLKSIGEVLEEVDRIYNATLQKLMQLHEYCIGKGGWKMHCLKMLEKEA